VKQKVELLEVITGFETNNKYVIKNAMGQQVYKVSLDFFWPTRGQRLPEVPGFITELSVPWPDAMATCHGRPIWNFLYFKNSECYQAPSPRTPQMHRLSVCHLTLVSQF